MINKDGKPLVANKILQKSLHSKLFLFLASYISKLNGIQILSRSFSPQRGLIKQLKIISSPTTTPLAGLYENHSVLIFLCLNKRSVGVCTTLISVSSWSSRALLCDRLQTRFISSYRVLLLGPLLQNVGDCSLSLIQWR